MANKLWLVESFYFMLRLVFTNNYPKDLCFISWMLELSNLVFKYRQHLHKSCRMCLKQNIEEIATPNLRQTNARQWSDVCVLEVF